MKPIHVIGITLATAFGIIWCVQIWSAGRWNTELRGEGNGTYYEGKRSNESVAAFTREAFNESPMPEDHTPTGVSKSSWVDRLQNVIKDCVRSIKSIRRQPRRAPPGIYFTLLAAALQHMTLRLAAIRGRA